jgi:hypothetical protein
MAVSFEVSAAEASRTAAVNVMLSDPSLACSLPSRALAEVLSACAPACSLAHQAGGLASSARGVIAMRPLSVGEVLLEESALCWKLARSAGSDTYAILEDPDSNVLGALPPWHALRLLRDTLCFSPTTTPEEGFSLLSELTAYGAVAKDFAAGAGREGMQPQLLPTLPPGEAAEEEGGGSNAVPRRAQLLHAIFQCNAHAAALPEDGQWLRGLLWPLLGRIESAQDRERLFDDERPFSAVAALFAGGACFNHSCQPNCLVKAQWVEGQEAPQLAICAARDIAAGEELTYSYTVETPSVRERRRELLLTYRFRCCCAKCRSEEPLAGLEGDPLAQCFPYGFGLDAQADVQRGGALWQEAC